MVGGHTPPQEPGPKWKRHRCAAWCCGDRAAAASAPGDQRTQEAASQGWPPMAGLLSALSLSFSFWPQDCRGQGWSWGGVVPAEVICCPRICTGMSGGSAAAAGGTALCNTQDTRCQSGGREGGRARPPPLSLPAFKLFETSGNFFLHKPRRKSLRHKMARGAGAGWAALWTTWPQAPCSGGPAVPKLPPGEASVQDPRTCCEGPPRQGAEAGEGQQNDPS